MTPSEMASLSNFRWQNFKESQIDPQTVFIPTFRCERELRLLFNKKHL